MTPVVFEMVSLKLKTTNEIYFQIALTCNCILVMLYISHRNSVCGCSFL